jgi:raffinose/stachyose/melibiose transport system permease protein
MTKSRQRKMLLLEIVILILALIFLYPLLLVIINSFKNYNEIMTNVVSLPHSLILSNYSDVWGLMNYPVLFLNTLFITVISVGGILLFGSMAGYKLSRTRSKMSSILFFLAIAPMMLPFQSFMITLTKLSKDLHLINSLVGINVIYWGLGIPLSVFMFHGFVKSIPLELEECASIDGCSPFKIYYKIVFPIMIPVISTVAILNVMWIWNDFLLPLIMLNGKGVTLQLAAYKFFGQYKSDWNYALTAVIYVTTPPVLFFLFMQKFIIKGMVAGAVKG